MSKDKGEATRVRTRPQTLGLTVEEAVLCLLWATSSGKTDSEHYALTDRLEKFLKDRDGG